MTPIETTQFDWQFTAPLSAWWLLLLLPPILGAVWWLYWRETAAQRSGHRGVLIGLRVGLIAALLVLAFRPNLAWQRVLTYPGRIVVVVDDSRSMTTTDSRLSDGLALQWERRLRGANGERAACYDIADLLETAAGRVRAFEWFARSADRGQDAFWERAGKVQEDIARDLDQCERLAKTVSLRETSQQRDLLAAQQQIAGLRAGLGALFTGDKHPGRKAYEKFSDQAEATAAQLVAIQGAAYESDIAAGNTALGARADAVRSRTRLDLANEALSGLQSRLTELAPGQAVQLVRLSSGQTFVPGKLSPDVAPTDLVGWADRLDGEGEKFPVSGLILLSDGRDVAGRSVAALEQQMTRRQIPVFAAAAGAAREPVDIAVLDVVAPPFAAAGSPVVVKARLKTSLREPREVNVNLFAGEQRVATTTATLGQSDEATVSLQFTPPRPGLSRYAVRVDSVEGEAFATQNNAADFAVDVRPDRIRVLYLDHRPRWETRFALNIFGRLGYVDLNSIIVIVQKDGALARGTQRGAWPADLDALSMYDLVVIGDVPADLLSATEWNDLRTLVEQRGKTVCFLGSADREAAFWNVESARAMLPILPAAGPATRATGEADLALSETGALHVSTRMLSGAVEQTPPPVDRLTLGSMGLLHTRTTRQPLIAARFLGAGRTMLIDTDQLWKQLNATHLPAHAAIYGGLVTWSLQGSLGDTDPSRPRLALDCSTAKTGQAFQVHALNVQGDAMIEAVANDTVLAEAPLSSPVGSTGLRRAVFASLPSADVQFRLKGDPTCTVGPLVVVAEDAELKVLARDEALLSRVASATGGQLRDFVDLERFFPRIEPKQRIERHETVWRLWDAKWVLLLLAGVLTIEWVWRKLVGLV